MKGSNATWMMISIELYWDKEITDTSTNSKWKRPLSAGEMMAVVLQLCVESFYKRPVKEKQALQHPALVEIAMLATLEKSHHQVISN